MKELVEFMAKSLVSNPEAVVVVEKETEDTIAIEISVAPEDMGKIIGKQGRIAKSIRTITKSAGYNTDKKILVDIID